MEKEILTTFEAAKYCHVHPGTIKNWIKNENLKAFKTPGGHRRIYKRDLDLFLKENNIPLIYPSKSLRKRVLIIDNDYLVRESISKALLRRMEYFEIAAAANGFEGGELLVTFKPDLVIMDMALPGVDIVETCRHIKSSPHQEETMVLILDGSSDSPQKKLLEKESDGILSKPIDIGKLCFEVEKLLGFKKAK
ncbi:MAG TPA: response regulator [archaeon]|nr:response regulator [archaeon]